MPAFFCQAPWNNTGHPINNVFFTKFLNMTENGVRQVESTEKQLQLAKLPREFWKSK